MRRQAAETLICHCHLQEIFDRETISGARSQNHERTHTKAAPPDLPRLPAEQGQMRPRLAGVRPLRPPRHACIDSRRRGEAAALCRQEDGRAPAALGKRPGLGKSGPDHTTRDIQDTATRVTPSRSSAPSGSSSHWRETPRRSSRGPRHGVPGKLDSQTSCVPTVNGACWRCEASAAPSASGPAWKSILAAVRGTNR